MAARSGSRLALYMKNMDKNPDLNLQHSYDYFVVASCKISVQMGKNFQMVTKLDTSSKVDLLDEFPDNINPILLFINDKGSLGASVSDLLEKFGSKDAIYECLDKFLNEKLVYRVGVVEPRFVSSRNCKPWFLHSFDIKRFHRENTHENAEENVVKSAEKIDWNKVDMMDLKVSADAHNIIQGGEFKSKALEN